MKRAVSICFLSVLLLSAGLSAQDKPSFAGTWKLVPGTGGEGMFVISEMIVAQDAKQLTVTATGQMGQFKTVYNLDGTDTRSPLEFNGNTIDRVTKAAWDATKLMLTVKTDFGGQAFETKAVWSLGADGTLVVETTAPDFQGGGAPLTSKSSYKKG